MASIQVTALPPLAQLTKGGSPSTNPIKDKILPLIGLSAFRKLPFYQNTNLPLLRSLNKALLTSQQLTIGVL